MSRRGGRGGHSRSSVAVSKELLKRSASEAGLDDRHLKVLSDITRPPLYPDFLWRSTGKYWTEDDATNNGCLGMGTESVQIPSTKRPASMISLINKHREFTKRFQNSPHFVRPTAVSDIVRYCDRQKHANSSSAPDSIVLASFSKSNRRLATDQRYFPSELLNMNGSERRPKRKQLDSISTASVVPSKNYSNRSGVNDSVDTKLVELVYEESSSSLVVSGATVGLTRAAVATNASSEAAPDINEDDEDEDGLAPVHEDEEEGEDYTTNYYNTDDESDHDHDGEPTY
jgi:hypothetical protein